MPPSAYRNRPRAWTALALVAAAGLFVASCSDSGSSSSKKTTTTKTTTSVVPTTGLPKSSVPEADRAAYCGKVNNYMTGLMGIYSSLQSNPTVDQVKGAIGGFMTAVDALATDPPPEIAAPITAYRDALAPINTQVQAATSLDELNNGSIPKMPEDTDLQKAVVQWTVANCQPAEVPQLLGGGGLGQGSAGGPTPSTDTTTPSTGN